VLDTKGRSAVYAGKHVIDRNHDPADVVRFAASAGHVTGKYLKKQAAGDPLFETLRDRAEFKALVQQ
jgi:hypothetical protein